MMLACLSARVAADVPLSDSNRNGDLQTVKRMIASGQDLNAKTFGGQTPLEFYAMLGDTDCIRALITAGANPNRTNGSGWTPLMTSAYWGKTATVKELVADGVALNIEDSGGETALDLADDNRKPDCIDILLAAGALDESWSMGGPPHSGEIKLIGYTEAPRAAASAFHLETKYVIVSGGPPVYFLRARNKTIDLTNSTKIVMGDGSRGSIGDLSGQLVVIGRDTGIGRPLAARLILAAGGQTAIENAAEAGNIVRVKQLIAAGANVNARDKSGSTALLDASLLKHVSCVKALIAAGADVNAKDTGSQGQTPLMLASLYYEPDVLRSLIGAHADVNAKDVNGFTALLYASDPACIKDLAAAGADVDAQSEDGMTALMNVVTTAKLECVRALLAAGANVNLKDAKGKTALDYALTSPFRNHLSDAKFDPVIAALKEAGGRE
jgi:ankyrin repeat protein